MREIISRHLSGCPVTFRLSSLRIRGLHVYPLKSAGGVSPDTWPVDEFGLAHDRRWMVVNSRGHLMSQRSHPRLALVQPTVGPDHLVLDAPGMAPLELALRPSGSVVVKVTVWDDTCDALWLGPRPAKWFSEVLGSPCELVYMPETSVRPADPAVAPDGVRVSFADGFPFLLISEESLADLNTRLPRPLPMDRFRPNIVIAGGEPYVEDTLERFEACGIRFHVVKPCGRCVVTTTDQKTAQRGVEPLRTLARYRKQGSEVMFGQNVIQHGTGRLSVGAPLLV
jgi:MOSC domain-containing protein